MDDILKDEDEDVELDVKLPPETDKGGDTLDEDTASVDDLAEEEDEEEPFDDINPI